MSTDRIRILVVDDERNTCRMLKLKLSDEGYEVDVANNGRAALEKVRQRRYDVVILDYRMPEMDGAELFRRIHRRQSDVRAVFLTGYPTIDTDFPAIDAGAYRVLSKPLDVSELLKVLETCVARDSCGDTNAERCP